MIAELSDHSLLSEWFLV